MHSILYARSMVESVIPLGLLQLSLTCAVPVSTRIAANRTHAWSRDLRLSEGLRAEDLPLHCV